MIWQQEVLDKIVSKIKPFSDSAKKYKANEEEKLFIESLAREMLNKNALQHLKIDRHSNGLLNFKYKNMQIGRINLRSKPTQLQIISQYDVRWLEGLSVRECIRKIPEWMEYLDYLMNK